MPKFRRKQADVEATQWTPGVQVEGVRDPVAGEKPWHHVLQDDGRIVQLEPTDWVVKDGSSFSVVKADQFNEQFEAVDDSGRQAAQSGQQRTEAPAPFAPEPKNQNTAGNWPPPNTSAGEDERGDDADDKPKEKRKGK